MAVAYKHKEYFRFRNSDNSLYTFTSLDDAKTLVDLHKTYLTSNSPTITYALADSDQTLEVTLEFADSAAQEAWKTAVDNLGDQRGWGSQIEFFKIDWLHKDGSSSSLANLK